MMIYDWTRKQATKVPNDIAVTSAKRHLSYASLESKSNRLASLLLISGLKDNGRVGLLMDKSPENIIAMHGVNKAGGINVPLDADRDVEHLARILEISEVSFIMVDHHSIGKYIELIQQHKNLEKISWVWWSKEICTSQDQYCPFFSLDDIGHQPDYPFQKNREENAPAFIYFDSSLKGNEKGITISHKNISTFINWAVDYFQVKRGDRITGYANYNSVLSAFDMYGTFAAGAHLYISPSNTSGMPSSMFDFILENDITQWFIKPSLLNQIAGYKILPADCFPGLKRLIWHGKEVPASTLRYWMQQLPEASFTNLYGPAEATIASSYFTLPEIPRKKLEIPIGKTCEGEKLLVLNEELKQVPKGGIGDLFISGDGLSVGYWRDNDKTSAAFLWYKKKDGEWERVFKTGDLASINADGLIYYHGNSDYKIKQKGPRLEIKEIEKALAHIKSLKEYAVIPIQKTGMENAEIGCAYVSSEYKGDEVAPMLKTQLSQTIPYELMPRRWKSYNKLPRRKDGKIDRKTLKEEFKQ